MTNVCYFTPYKNGRAVIYDENGWGVIRQMKLGYDPEKLYRCNKCHNEGTVEEMFGTRQVGYVIHKQPWCKNCRLTERQLRGSANVAIPFDRAGLKTMYYRFFPRDRCPSRSRRFMRDKLVGRLKERAVFGEDWKSLVAVAR